MVYTIKQAALTIEKEQALRQLELLGDKPDKVYLTAFFPKGDPRTKGENRDKGRKAQRLNYAEVEGWQAQGRGVYLVANGYGHGKEDVKLCRTIFYEHDTLEKGIQLTLWQGIGMPEPTFQVDSGGKSIHNYWILEEPIHPELWAFQEPTGQWKGLQADLLELADADRSLVNPNRVMRLAGAWYFTHDENGTHPVAQSRIVGGCGKRYSYAELRGIIPRTQPTFTRPIPHNQEASGEGLLDFRKVGHILPHWDERGREGWATFQCPVHTNDGKKHSQDHIHVNQSNGAWEAHCGCDRKIIYQTVCDMVGHKPTGRSFSGGIGSGGSGGNRRGNGGAGGSGSDGGDGDGSDRNDKVVKFPSNSSSPLEYVKQVLKEAKTKVERDSAFISSPYNPRDLQAIARELEKFEDTNEEQQEAKEALPRLLQKLSLNPHDYLWGDGGQLAQAIVDTATAMPTSPSFLITTLLPVAATLIGTSSRVVVKPSAKYKQSCVIQTGVVGRSGKIKTPSQQVIVHPLERLEVGAANRYEQELEAYRIAYTKWKRDKGDPEDEPKAPIRKRYLTKDTTLESLERIHGQNPRGILVYRDELVGDFKAENSHRGGKGADKEAKLDQFNGGAIIVDRKEREIILERSAISRTGSIQWEVLQNLMGDHDDSAGVFARWIFDCAESAPRFIQFDDAPDTGIDHLLTNLYKRLELMPHADYLLSFEAKGVFQEWQHYLVNRELRESGGLQLVFPKIEAYTARFALWLHVVNAALAGETPAPTIDGHTMSRAVDMARYYLSQYELIIATNSPQTGLTGVLLKIFNHLKGKPDGTTIGKLKAGIRSLRGVDKTEIEFHCQWLADNGYVTLDGKKIQIVDTVDKKLTPVSTAERYIKQWFPEKVDKVDKLTALDLKNNPPQVELSGTKAPIEGVNFVNLSTDSPQPTVKQEVDAVDRKVDNEDVAVNSVNFSDPPVVIDDAVGVTKETEEAIALRVKSEAQIATIPVEQKAPTSADEVDEAIAPTTPAKSGRDATGKFRVGDRVLIKAGGVFDGKLATVLPSDNSTEICVRLDEADGGFNLSFRSEYLIRISC